MLDRYLKGQVGRISPEAPVPVLKLESEENLLGGAANVACNLVSLGAQASVVGVIGEDAEGELLLRDLSQAGLFSDAVVQCRSRLTSVKSRIVSQTQQMIRVDRESDGPLTEGTQAELELRCLSTLESCDAVILSDYDKGVLTPEFTRKIIHSAKASGKRVFVDPKGRSYDKYAGASFLTPNHSEAEAALANRHLQLPEDLEETARAAIERLQLEGLVITLGKQGLFVASSQPQGFRSLNIEAQQREVYDVTGAGDTVLAVFSLMMTAGLDAFDAARWANTAAGVVVGKAGAASVALSELAEYAQRFEPWVRKVKSIRELGDLVNQSKKKGHRVVFTNGCFDLLHAGHIQLLHAARALGDVLVVGVNSDRSVHGIKGEGRPLIPEKERLQILASLDCVDYLVVFDERTPNELLETLQPDILAKGANYSAEEVTGHEIVEGYGGRIELLPIRSNISVSGLVGDIVERFAR